MSPEQRERLVAEPAGETMTIGELSDAGEPAAAQNDEDPAR